MIDRDHVGQAGLAALGWLDDSERADFEHECQINPDLRSTRAEVCDVIAAVAATAPVAEPPPHALAAIFSRLPTPTKVAAQSPASAWPPRLAGRALPWAAAAGFALLAAWMGWRSDRTALRSQHQLPESPDAAGRAPGDPGPARMAGPRGNGPEGADGTDAKPNPPRPDAFPPRYFTNRPGDPELRLQQDTERLRAEVSKLRAAENARQQLPSGISDLRVVEMLPPGTKKAPEKSELLSARVAEAIASGMKPSAPARQDPKPGPTPTAPDPIQLRGHGARPDANIEVVGEDLVSLGTLNLHPDAQVVHRNFPPPEDYARLGLTPLDEQTVYDGHGGLWHRSADGSEWIGQKAPASFTAPDPDDPAPGAGVPPLRPAPAPQEAPAGAGTSEPSGATEPGLPYALPVLDQQGRGTLIVQNLPPAPDGEFYYLWMTDPRFSGPVNVGVLPAIETAHDHFSFDLGTPGFVPTGYLLTLEKAGAQAAPGAPSGTIVLQGP